MPEPRTLTAEEAARASQRDWLFQAMGKPLLPRAAKEIGWARELAKRTGETADFSQKFLDKTAPKFWEADRK